ncbi:MAG: hypothetical protein ACUVQ0_02100 [Thermoproteota archaeon]
MDKGFTVSRFKKTEFSVFSRFSYLGVDMRLEALFKNVRRVEIGRFETVGGAFMLVNVLRPEEMLR